MRSLLNRILPFKLLFLEITVVFCLPGSHLKAKGINPLSVPGVISYTKNDYNAGSQNWNIAQDNNGILYFANHDGLLQYDGNSWHLYKLPDKMVVRSVAIDKNNRIYTGSYEEFGYWEESKNGTLHYYSLSKLLKNYQFNNEEIWRIVFYNNKVFFQSFGAYFVYDGRNVTHFQTPGTILFFLPANKNIFTQGINSGLFQLVQDTLFLVPHTEIFKNDLIYSALLIDSTHIVLGTATHGLFLYDINRNSFTPWKTEADEILKSGQVNCGILVSDSILCFGTIGRGVVAVDLNGKLLWHFYKDHSLTSNTVLNIFADNQSNIWLALDRGIALIHNNSPIRFIPVKTTNIELVYCAVEFKKSIYLGTNQGLYELRVTDTENQLTLIPETLGQVWQLSVIDGQLICGHNNGTFRVEGSKVVRISSLTGGSTIRQIYPNTKEYLIQGTYTELSLYTRNSSGYWEFNRSISGFSHPVRYLEVDPLGYIWASHVAKGVFRIKLNDDMTAIAEVKLYNISKSPRENFQVNVFKVDNRILFCSGEKLYTYDDLNDQIVPYKWLNNQLGEFASSHLVIPQSKDCYWFVDDEQFALFRITKNHAELLDLLPFASLNNNLIDDNEYVTPVDSGNYLFCLDNGLAIYDKSKQNSNGINHCPVLIRQVKAISDRENVLLPLISNEKNSVEIPFAFRQLMFSFAYPDYSNSNIHYYYKLNNSGKTPISVRELNKTFTNLPADKYMLEVFAENEINGKTTSATYYFKINPPLYASLMAYIIYFITFLLIFFITWRIVKRRIYRQHEKEMKEQARIQQERIDRKEQKIVMLKNEKLNGELLHKSKELASATMAIIRKNDMLITFRREIETQKDRLGSQFPNKYYDKLIHLIDDNISSEDDWKIFQQNFDILHENFFRHLKKQHQDLTVHDLKLCAYLRLNLSTKEIASLLNISIRGVEAARHRLRKKLSVPLEKNLIEFLMEIK